MCPSPGTAFWHEVRRQARAASHSAPASPALAATVGTESNADQPEVLCAHNCADQYLFHIGLKARLVQPMYKHAALMNILRDVAELGAAR